MSGETTDAPWGQASFDLQQEWQRRLAAPKPGLRSRDEFTRARAQALADPDLDLFDEYIPMDTPKLTVGLYVQSQGIPVPIIASQAEWQDALATSTAMLRSELWQDYAGFSGLLRSRRLGLRPHETHTTLGMLASTHPGMGRIALLEDYIGDSEHSVGNAAVTALIRDTLVKGLADGTVNPAKFMELACWHDDAEQISSDAIAQRYRPPEIDFFHINASRWRYIPGVNVRIFRDPVITGKYYVGGAEAHHEWEITDGRNSPDLQAHEKAVYRGYRAPGEPEYVLPTSQLVDLYERVRTLPYFDQRQAPVMEMQYGDDDTLYFLQYLKTGQKLGDPGEFALPSGQGVVTADWVRGVTTPTGEKVRIYIDPRKFTRNMQYQAFMTGFNMQSRTGLGVQVACALAKVMIIDSGLNFKDNHTQSTPLYRPPVAISLWDKRGEVETAFKGLEGRIPFWRIGDPYDEVHYVDAIVTANGRQATVASDWELKTEALN